MRGGGTTLLKPPSQYRVRVWGLTIISYTQPWNVLEQLFVNPNRFVENIKHKTMSTGTRNCKTGVKMISGDWKLKKPFWLKLFLSLTYQFS
jgi:hypothetical protein